MPTNCPDYYLMFYIQPFRHDQFHTSQLHLSRLKVSSWQAIGEWPSR